MNNDSLHATSPQSITQRPRSRRAALRGIPPEIVVRYRVRLKCRKADGNTHTHTEIGRLANERAVLARAKAWAGGHLARAPLHQLLEGVEEIGLSCRACAGPRFLQWLYSPTIGQVQDWAASHVAGQHRVPEEVELEK